ncbi:hypothetical protein E3N88_22681 [Mikania micrantha]|uniref:Uncharacterized protein n=1 Tax=Mikania micrantha TaxID=192012 RepID=A0A5N6NCV1_9ASTR|nr:hypothetical protein E3N88_22681 [Mikania micrantha]
MKNLDGWLLSNQQSLAEGLNVKVAGCCDLAASWFGLGKGMAGYSTKPIVDISAGLIVVANSVERPRTNCNTSQESEIG